MTRHPVPPLASSPGRRPRLPARGASPVRGREAHQGVPGVVRRDLPGGA